MAPNVLVLFPGTCEGESKMKKELKLLVSDENSKSTLGYSAGINGATRVLKSDQGRRKNQGQCAEM